MIHDENKLDCSQVELSEAFFDWMMVERFKYFLVQKFISYNTKTLNCD